MLQVAGCGINSDSRVLQALPFSVPQEQELRQLTQLARDFNLHTSDVGMRELQAAYAR